MSAYNESDTIVFEVKLDSITKAMVDEMLYTKNINESNVATEILDTLKDLYPILKTYPDLESLNAMGLASLISNSIYSEVVYSALYGIDYKFYQMAKADNKNIDELESGEQQVGYVIELGSSCPNFILSDVYDKEAIVEEFQALEKLLFKPITDSSTPYYDEYLEYNRILITNRNLQMLEKTEEYFMNDKTYFIVVGLGHLMSEEGLLNELEKQGYSIVSMKP
jgi:Uncharacterized protein conserved in bacteria